MQTHNCLQEIPRLELGCSLTPLHRLHRIEEALEYREIWIKRDDLNGLGPGGNKVRSLEYLLAEAVGQGCDVVLASGPLQSNLCTLTAAACAKLGLRCILVFNAVRPAHFEGNLLLNSLFDAEMHFLGEVSSAKREETTALLCEEAKQQGHRPYRIQNGATTGRGALGYVRAIAELTEQCAQNKMENLTLYAPVGNGGVAAGLILGNWLAGLPFRIVAVSVEHEESQACAHIEQVIAESAAILEITPPKTLAGICRITDEFRGEGWGYHTPESANAVLRLARLEGILTEHIYNSKVFVTLETELRRGTTTGPVCLLHTGGIGSLYAQYPDGHPV